MTQWIESIEDVTDKALALAKVIEEDEITDEEELRKRGLLPREEVYRLEPELQQLLGMN